MKDDEDTATDVTATSPSASDGRFHALVEQSADGILVVDPGGYIRFANRAAASLLRRPTASLVGHLFGYPAVSDEAAEITVAPLAEAGAVTELRAAEIQWDGRPALLVNLRDITERKHQEQRNAQLSSARRAVLEVERLLLRERDQTRLLREACRILARQGNYLAASIALHDAPDQPPWFTEATDRPGLSFEPAMRPSTLPPCAEQALRSPLEVVRKVPPDDSCSQCPSRTGHEDHARIVATLQSDGEVFGLLSLAVPAHHCDTPEELELVRRLAADLGHAIGAARASAARELAETRLGQSERRFRSLFENSSDAILIADASGAFQDVNPAACEMFGIPRERLLTMSVADLPVPEGHPDTDQRYQQYVAVGRESGAFTFVAPDATTRVAEYSAFQLEPDRFVSVLRDVTDRISLEAQLRQSQKMEAVGRLAGGVAHDFNNLLTAILSFAGFARDGTAEGDPRRDDLDEVIEAGERGAALTRQLLAFSRRQTVAPTQVDLNELVGGVERLLRRTLGEHIELETRLDERLWPVWVDSGQFEQVLINLAVNARDAMPSGGKLVIETSNGVDRGPLSGECVSLRVRDTGIGMSERVKAQVFEPFFTTKERGEGTGLGLSMAHGVVTQAGGTITVDSEPGRGTCIEACLPRARGEARADSLSDPRGPASSGSETILVIDDEAVIRRAAARMLRAHGHAVIEAAGGAEALALMDEGLPHIDLVVCDVAMPRMGGPEVVQALRQRRPDLPALFISGYPDEARATPLDPDAEILLKPFSRRVLIERVRRVLDGAHGR